MPAVSLSQLESHLWEAANILRGPVDAADFKSYVFPLLFFKRLSDVHDDEHEAALKEAYVVVCRTQKPKARRGKILFINAVNEVTRERAQSFLTDEHLLRVVRAYQDFKDEPGFTRVVPIEEISGKEGNLSIPLYVGGDTQAQTDVAAESASTELSDALADWLRSSTHLRKSLSTLLATP